MSNEVEKPGDIDWSLTTWEGSRREQLRRWSELPLERIIAAIEEMDDISRHLAEAGKQTQQPSSVAEPETGYSNRPGRHHEKDT